MTDMLAIASIGVLLVVWYFLFERKKILLTDMTDKQQPIYGQLLGGLNETAFITGRLDFFIIAFICLCY